MTATRNDLSPAIREQAIDLLNQHLADAFDLYSQTKQAHWNVKGTGFFQLHELFDKLADSLEDHVDTIAERATALGGTAMGTARMSAAASRIAEYPAAERSGREHVEALADRFATLARCSRAAIDKAGSIGDADTADLFTGISRDLDKHLWFLEAHLTGS